MPRETCGQANTVLSQLQSGAGTGEEAYKSMFDCFAKIIRNEGYVFTIFSLSRSS
jgi:hypothetical protein